MRFETFLRYNLYPIAQQKLIFRALNAFFKSARMRPFSDAISRSNNTLEKTKCKKMIKDFSDKFMKNINSQEGKNSYDFSQDLEAELKKSPEYAHLKGTLFEGFLRKTLFWEFSEIIDAIQLYITNVGAECIATEHRLACEFMEHDRLISFDEYLGNSWLNASDGKDIFKPTVQQWYGYLMYIDEVISPFKTSNIDTENKQKALALSEKIEAACHQIKKSTQQLQELNTLYQATEIKIKSVVTERGEIKLDYFFKNNKLPNEDDKCPVEIIQRLDYLKKTYGTLYRTRFQVRHLIARTSTFFSDHNGLDRSSELVKRFDPELDYWQDNLPKINRRSDDIQTIAAYHSDSKERDIIYRYISKDEHSSLSKNKRFNQSPKHSLEREKWFFYEGANPGNGVTHPVFCTVYLKKGALTLLLKLQKPDGQFAAVVSKENEHHCIGVHEDALHAFNHLIDKIECCETASKKLLKTIHFPAINEESLTEAMHKNIRPSFLLFASTHTQAQSHQDAADDNDLKVQQQLKKLNSLL